MSTIHSQINATWVLVEALLGCYIIEEEAWRNSEASGCFVARIIFPLTTLPTCACARGPPWAVCTGLLELPPGAASGVLGCVAGNLSTRFSWQWGSSTKVKEACFLFPVNGPIYKLVCPAKRKEILIVFSHLSFPNASTISGVLIKSQSCFTHVSFVFSWNDNEIKACIYETDCENFWKYKVFIRLRGVVGSYFIPLWFCYSLRTLTLLPEILL